MSKSLYTTIIETTPPTTTTVGIVGQKYLDTTNKKVYFCVGINTDSGTSVTTYEWKLLAFEDDIISALNTEV